MVNHEHGTRHRYGRGCRCEPCRRAWADYYKNYRRANGRPTRAGSLVAADLQRTRAIVAQAVRDEQDVQVPVRLSPLAGQILLVKMQRTGRSRGDVLDELLRVHGAEEARSESTA